MKLTFDDVAGALVRQPYVFARTMRWCPHWYCLRDTWTGPDFESVVQFIRDNGYKERFRHNVHTRLDVNGFKYWTVGEPLPQCRLINRTQVDRPAPYDRIAPVYDDLHASAAAREEEERAWEAADYRGGRVLDVGCGTGMLLDLMERRHEVLDSYFGIDPSAQMLCQLRQKHPMAEVMRTGFESFYAPRGFELIVALFGAASYIPPPALRRVGSMLSYKGRAFFMFYGDGYNPRTHHGSGVAVPYFGLKDSLAQLDGWEIEEWGDYVVARTERVDR